MPKMSIKELLNEIGPPKKSKEVIAGYMQRVAADLSPLQRASPDLAWFYGGHVDAAIGHRAMPFMPSSMTYEAAELAADGCVEERVIKVMGRQRPILRAIGMVDPFLQRVLATYFGDRRQCDELNHVGDVGCILHMTDTAKGIDVPLREAVRKTSTRDVLKTAAEKLLARACEAYLAARTGRATAERGDAERGRDAA